MNTMESNRMLEIKSNKNMAYSSNSEPQASKLVQWVDNPAFGENTENKLDLNLDCSSNSMDSEERRIFGEDMNAGKET